jgi:hypothetical protein
VVVYVDDCIFAGKSMQAIDGEITTLKKTFDLDKEDDMAGFLGVSIETDKHGAKTLTQTGLIDRILLLTNLADSTGKDAPATNDTLDRDLSGEPRQEDWSYRSVLGMMLYLSSNSRPDIPFAVNQCAQYSTNSTLKHETAVKRIARYLQQTRTRGMIISPRADLCLDLWVDADFAGLWNHNDAEDPLSVKSRTGCVITFDEIPVVWRSKLQGAIALSTCEAEYIAASQGMRELVPLRETISFLTREMGIERDNRSTVSTIWEDNPTALTIMTNQMDGLPKLSPRTRHIGTKYHRFLANLGPTLLPRKIHTKQQKADIFTKGTPLEDFRRTRLLLLG